MRQEIKQILDQYTSAGQREEGLKLVERMMEAERKKKLNGLGDLVKKGTDLLKIKQCGGCKKRQEWLNKKFPFKDAKTPPT